MLSQALMSSASGTDILETENIVEKAKLQQNGSSTDDEISNNGNREEEVQDIGANDNNDTNSADMVYIDRNKVNGALANKQLIKVASFLLPTLGVGALSGSAYHFLKKEDEPNLEDTKIKKEDNKVTGNLNTSTSVWRYVITLVVVLIIGSAVYVYYRKNNKKEYTIDNTIEKQNENNNVSSSSSGNEETSENKNKNDDEGKSEGKFIDNKKKVEHESNNKEKNNTENKIVDNEKSYFKTLCDKCDKFKKALEKDPACVIITGKTIVVGDLHFNTGAALFVKKYFEERFKEGYNLVFLGDFIDRGYQATDGNIFEEDGETVDEVATAKWRLKTLEIIMDLKIQYPDKVIVLSGNHEADRGVQKEFPLACVDTFGEDGKDVYNKANEAFGELPKCAVLKQKDNDNNDLNTFLVHGSVPCSENVPCPEDSVKFMDSKKLEKDILNDMSNLNRKKFYKYKDKPENEGSGIVSGMLWNDYRVKDPWTKQYYVCEKDVFNGGRGAGYFISEQSLEVFKKANNIQGVISAHDHTESSVDHKDVNYRKIITSQNMNGKKSDGYILVFDDKGGVEPVKVEEISYKKFKQQGANNANNINNKNFKDKINNNIIIQNNINFS